VSALLELDNLTVRYGQIEALRGIRISVEPGEIVTLIGANGAGKSTTLRHQRTGASALRGDPLEGSRNPARAGG